MINEFDQDRMEIRVLLDNENNYIEGLKRINILENKLKGKINNIDKDDMWFIYYDKAWISFKYEDYDKMLKYVNKAKLYYETDHQKNLISWLLVEYYKSQGNIEKSLEEYNEIENFYKENDKPIFASNIRVNKALLVCNIKVIKSK